MKRRRGILARVLGNYAWGLQVNDRDIPLWLRVIWPTLHYCADWDGMIVGRGMPEFESCVCAKGGA